MKDDKGLCCLRAGCCCSDDDDVDDAIAPLDFVIEETKRNWRLSGTACSLQHHDDPPTNIQMDLTTITTTIANIIAEYCSMWSTLTVIECCGDGGWKTTNESFVVLLRDIG